MNIFFLGDTRGAYRTENIIKALFELEYRNLYINSFTKNKFFRTIANLLMILQSDIVFVGPIQHNNRLIKVAAFFKKRIVTDFYISFYDSEVNDYKKIDKNSKQARKIREVDRFALEKSEIVIFLNETERDYFCKTLDIESSKLNAEIIPLCINPKPEAELNYFNGKSDVFNLCWVGTFIPLQGVEKIIETLKIIVETNSLKVHLTIWGNSEEKSEPYKKMVRENGLNNYVTFINKWESRDEWYEFIKKNCDLTLGIFGDSRKAKTVVANKVIDGIAFKTPTLTGESSGLYNFFDGEKDIFVVNNEPNEMAMKIIEIAQMHPETIKARIENSHKIYKDRFSYEEFKSNLSSLLKKLK